MQKFKSLATPRLAVFFGAVVLALGVTWPLMGIAQDKNAKTPDANAQHKNTPALGNQKLASQVAELKARIARLEAALAKNATGKSVGMGGMGGKKPAMAMPDDAMPDDAMPDDAMGGMADKKPAMGMMDDDMMSGMEDMDMMEMMGMMGMAPKGGGGMGGTKSMATMQKKSALPNFPGASHIYHVGATDFFLNHPEHIKLTPEQKGDLGRIKEVAVLAKTSAKRKIDEAEQELWTLTSSDEPDAAKIEGKIQEIEKLRGDQRIALIRAVGDAAKLLTDEQRQALLGTGADETAKLDSKTTAKPDPHAGHKP